MNPQRTTGAISVGASAVGTTAGLVRDAGLSLSTRPLSAIQPILPKAVLYHSTTMAPLSLYYNGDRMLFPLCILGFKAHAVRTVCTPSAT
jgi:hypothetical protein